MATPKRTLEDFADEHASAQFTENQELARTARAARAAAKGIGDQLAEAQAEVVALERDLTLYRRAYTERPKWLAPPKKASADHGTLIAFFSDAHYGEVIDPAQMGGYNKYDLAIAEKRTALFFANTVRLAREHLTGVKYDGIVLALDGDLVSGDIHTELEQTNALSTYDTTVWAVPRLAAGIELLQKEFGNVHVVAAPGNHGRDEKIPRYKGRSAHNADTHIARILPLVLPTSGDITFDIPESLDATFSVYNWNFGLEHGDELTKNFSGSAEIGWLGPLVRGTNRKINAYAAEGKTLHYCCWAHGHQFLPIPARGAIGNGCICGYNEFARGKKFRPEPPQQALIVVDAVHGVTIVAPIFVQDRASEKW